MGTFDALLKKNLKLPFHATPCRSCDPKPVLRASCRRSWWNDASSSCLLTMALESVEHHLETRGRGRYRAEMPITLLRLWMERLGDFALLGDYHREITLDELLNPESLVGSGLESWAEPRHMVSFIFSLRHFPRDDIDIMIDIARALSRNWQDRQKAGAFGAAAAFYVSRLSSDY